MFPQHSRDEGTVLLEKLEEALYSVAHCMNLNSLETSARARFLFALDELSAVWSSLIRARELPPEQARRLRTITEVCKVVRTASEEEAVVLSAVIERLLSPRMISRSEGGPPEPAEAEVTQSPTSTEIEGAVVEPTVAEAEKAPEAERITVAAQPGDGQSAQTEPQTVLSQPETEPRTAESVEPSSEEATASVEAVPYAGMSAVLNEVSSTLDMVANHDMEPERARALLMFVASRLRWLRLRSAYWERAWEVEQVKLDLSRIGKERQIWMPPLDPSYEFSDHELEVLAEGYLALERSWRMWDWYRQFGTELDKNTASPLLESIAAPLAMIQQIYQPKDILPQVSEADGTASLREQLFAEVSRRKWKIEMLSLTCKRDKQIQHIKLSDERWEAAKQQVEKKNRFKTALDALENRLHCPNAETFEEDVLCALLECHRAQVPSSDLRLRQIMNGYDWLLENPAVPERLGLTPKQATTARNWLIKLGQQLAADQLKERKAKEPDTDVESEPPDETIEKAKRITAGKKLFLLCFNRRADAERRIQEALGFSEVDWPDLDGGESITELESRIRRADMTIVVVRYSRTHWKEAIDVAKGLGKLAVMATKGYGVTHLAQQIVNQCSSGAGG